MKAPPRSAQRSGMAGILPSQAATVRPPSATADAGQGRAGAPGPPSPPRERRGIPHPRRPDRPRPPKPTRTPPPRRSVSGRQSAGAPPTDASARLTTPPNASYAASPQGRKSSLFAGSDRGGEHAAFIYTLIGTANLNDVDPQAWLDDVLAPHRLGKASKPASAWAAPGAHVRPARACAASDKDIHRSFTRPHPHRSPHEPGQTDVFGVLRKGRLNPAQAHQGYKE